MTVYKDKLKNKRYRLLAYATRLFGDGCEGVVVYCQDNNDHNIFVISEKEFLKKFDVVR